MVLSLIFHFKILTQQPAIIVAVMKLKKNQQHLLVEWAQVEFFEKHLGTHSNKSYICRALSFTLTSSTVPFHLIWLYGMR